MTLESQARAALKHGDLPAAVAAAKALTVDNDEWKAEIPEIEEWFAKFGENLPTQLQVELDGLKARLGVE